MPNPLPPTDFFGKTWIFRAQAITFGGLALFAAVMGPLFLTGVLRDAQGRPAASAGMAMSILCVPFAGVWALARFNLKARRAPILCIRREGLVYRAIGESSLDRFRLVPKLLRVVWTVVSGQGFAEDRICLPWDVVAGAVVTGVPLSRYLTIFSRVESHPADENEPVQVAPLLMLPDVAFKGALDVIADAVQAYSEQDESRAALPGWDEPG